MAYPRHRPKGASVITSIHIQGVATYTSPSELNDLRKINFIFGANGTGKTTISRVIEQAPGHEYCSMQWSGEARCK